jgi:hypothetical protein
MHHLQSSKILSAILNSVRWNLSFRIEDRSAIRAKQRKLMKRVASGEPVIADKSKF